MDIDKKAYMIDQAVSIDLPARRVVRQLYDAAFKAANKTLCLAAAQKISDVSDKGDSVFVLTGFSILPMNIAETDGPLGAAILTQTLQAMGLEPILVTDNLCFEVVKAASPRTSVTAVSVDAEQARLQAEQLLSEHNPSALVAIERPGWNSKQEYHNMKGLNISSSVVGKTDYLFTLGRKRGALTIGVGDGGNELGCGLISKTVRKHVPHGAECQCPCKSGIAAATPADVLVIAGVSNWGAYGIAACLSLLEGLEYKHDKRRELQLLTRVVKAGAIDSTSLEHKPFVDGLPPLLNGLVVDLICAVTNA